MNSPEGDAKAAFLELKSAVDKLTSLVPGIKFQLIPSNHFFVYRPGRPSLRLDVELRLGTNVIDYATGSGDGEEASAKGHFEVRRSADGALFLHESEYRFRPAEAAQALMRCFHSDSLIQST